MKLLKKKRGIRSGRKEVRQEKMSEIEEGNATHTRESARDDMLHYMISVIPGGLAP